MEKLLILLMAIAPLVTVSAFASERQRSTLHLLVITRISPLGIVSGKVLASLLYLVILVLTSLPALALVLQVGGVPFSSILLLYAFLLMTVFYTGMIGMFVSLYSRTTARALVIAAGAILAINLVFPSFQLYLSQLDRFLQAPAGAGWIEFFPQSENLYSTPEFPLYYLIDLFSPFSVYCNFRFVQLQEFQLLTHMGILDDQPRAAGDFTMVYHYLAVAAAASFMLIAGCVRRLQYLSTASTRRRKGVLAALQGQVGTAGLAGAFKLGFLLALGLRLTVDYFDPTPLQVITVFLMAIAALMTGRAGADSIVGERERHTLPLLATTAVGTREVLRRALLPAGVRLGWMVAGYFVGIVASNVAFALMDPSGADIESYYRGYKPVAISVVLRSVVCILGMGVFAAGVGLAFSAFSKRLVMARLGTALTLFVAWSLSTFSTDATGSTLGEILASDFSWVAKAPALVVAGLKDGLLFIVRVFNPFEAAAFPSRGALGFVERPAPLTGLLPLVASMILAALLYQTARLVLIRRDHFIE